MRAAQGRPVVEVLSNDEVLEVVVYGSLIVLQERVGIAQTVAGLSLHGSILQLPGQLQRLPGGRNTRGLQATWQRLLLALTSHWETLTCNVLLPLQIPPRRCTCSPGCSTPVSLLHGRQIPWR